MGYKTDTGFIESEKQCVFVLPFSGRAAAAQKDEKKNPYKKRKIFAAAPPLCPDPEKGKGRGKTAGPRRKNSGRRGLRLFPFAAALARSPGPHSQGTKNVLS